ncbi:hypothetical protein HMPREF1555_01118 [Porphyromonas gingivalis F0570]|uniref:Uncharacterized protein n=1 Tax=Porphyromonas gingivalis F0570 TaxID=1227271 RepID=A0A0E2LQD8_PORGN|nr:hypothetical protein HMPREF1555_01118 [Porphyromonas gingivalis F0570]
MLGIPLVRRVETTLFPELKFCFLLGIPLVRRVETTTLHNNFFLFVLGIPLVRRVETTIIPKGERGEVVLLMGKYF